MESKFKRPVHLVAFGLFLLALGGFLTLIHVGMSARRADRGIAHGFAFRGEAPARPGYAEAFIRGGEIVADRAGAFVSEFFSADGGKPKAGQSYAGARGGEEAGAGGRDPFEDFYERNYSGGANVPASDGYSAGSGETWDGSGGTVTAAPSGSAARAPATASRAGGAQAAAAAKAPAGAVAGKPLFGGPLGKAAGQPPRMQLQASLPPGGNAGGLERPGEMSGGRLSRGPAQGAGGAVSGMRGQIAAGDLNGADEAASSSSQGSYNSKMAGGAAAAAAAGAAAGGSAPAASAAEKVPAGGGASGGSGTSSSGDGKADADKKDADKTKSSPADDRSGSLAGDSEEDKPFLEAVAVEKRSGKDSRYITAEDRKGELEEGQLKSGSIPAETPAPRGNREKDFSASHARPAPEPDPEEFASLSEERKTELKRRIHGFMKRVEKRYGEMDDIFYTSCADGKELCSEHQLTEGYLTLKTQEDAELLLGLKYVESRWRRYTVGFALPGWGGRPSHHKKERQ